MNVILQIVVVAVLALAWLVTDAYAGPYHDLVIGPSVSADKPFFQDGIFMLGEEKISIEQSDLPKDKTVSYDPASHKILVSNDTSLSEVDKGAAVLQLMDALSIQAVEPAAGH
jgi:hypothetical protein